MLEKLQNIFFRFLLEMLYWIIWWKGYDESIFSVCQLFGERLLICSVFDDIG